VGGYQYVNLKAPACLKELPEQWAVLNINEMEKESLQGGLNSILMKMSGLVYVLSNEADRMKARHKWNIFTSNFYTERQAECNQPIMPRGANRNKQQYK
jgi:hypothetical protein